jgi:hypothetical protein
VLKEGCTWRALPHDRSSALKGGGKITSSLHATHRAVSTSIDTESKLNVGEVALNTAALTELIAQAKESGEAASVELAITESETKLAEEKKLTPAQVTALGEVADDDRVFDVSLLVGKTPITNFGNGTLAIVLPYTGGPGGSRF